MYMSTDVLRYIHGFICSLKAWYGVCEVPWSPQPEQVLKQFGGSVVDDGPDYFLAHLEPAYITSRYYLF